MMSEDTNCYDYLTCGENSGCFNKLIPSEIAFISPYITELSFRKGETMCKQHAFASNITYIVEGMVRLYLETEGNRDINVKIMLPTEFIGLSSLYADDKYVYSAVALTDCRICMFDRNNFRKLIHQNGDFAAELVKWYCRCEGHVFGLLSSIGQKQMHGRLADTLLYLCSEELQKADVFNFINRKDIADFACISTESTVRLLTELKNDGIIAMEGKNIEILDRKKLVMISEKG